MINECIIKLTKIQFFRGSMQLAYHGLHKNTKDLSRDGMIQNK